MGGGQGAPSSSSKESKHHQDSQTLYNTGADVDALKFDSKTELKTAGSSVKERTHFNSSSSSSKAPLKQAVLAGHTGAVLLLLEREADINATERDSKTALMLAAGADHIEIAHLLIDHGADIHAVGTDSKTALKLAAEAGHTKMVKLLMRYGQYSL